MLKDDKIREILSQCDVVAKLEQETAWAYAFDRPECVRKELISCSVDARSKLLDVILQLTPDDFD